MGNHVKVTGSVSPKFTTMSNRHETAVGIMITRVGAPNLGDVNTEIMKGRYLVGREKGKCTMNTNAPLFQSRKSVLSTMKRSSSTKKTQ